MQGEFACVRRGREPRPPLWPGSPDRATAATAGLLFAARETCPWQVKGIFSGDAGRLGPQREWLRCGLGPPGDCSPVPKAPAHSRRLARPGDDQDFSGRVTLACHLGRIALPRPPNWLSRRLPRPDRSGSLDTSVGAPGGHQRLTAEGDPTDRWPRPAATAYACPLLPGRLSAPPAPPPTPAHDTAADNRGLPADGANSRCTSNSCCRTPT